LADFLLPQRLTRFNNVDIHIFCQAGTLIAERTLTSVNLNTYLNYGGNCREAFEFYSQNLGGKILFMMTFDQMPDPTKAPPGMEKAVLHARMDIGGTILMASDTPPERFQPMRSVYLSLGVTSDAEAERLHTLLADGGEIFMPMAETFYATRFSMLRDKFGTSWMIIHERTMPAAA
jgi:PhnB protein